MAKWKETNNKVTKSILRKKTKKLLALAILKDLSRETLIKKNLFEID